MRAASEQGNKGFEAGPCRITLTELRSQRLGQRRHATGDDQHLPGQGAGTIALRGYGQPELIQAST